MKVHGSTKKIELLLGVYDEDPKIKPGIMACAYDPATLEAGFRNDVGLIPIRAKIPAIGGWIVLIQHKTRRGTWNLNETVYRTKIQSRAKSAIVR